ncbi:MAG: aspartate carbamoyltransferase [Cetobacterium sp.]|uniref:aspartate carbamoyltransferase n=1 Tax=Cetobacterium sp. ZWU0022 TaxID=1340502 RepID=UPI000648DCF6|nr:aspartate carbamoyltransferase [Cetobacterium sp. ZWU0022]
MRDFISMKDFTKGDILEVLRVAKELEKKNEELLKNKIVGSLFFEPSTRTRLSFTSAAYRLGAKVLGFDSPDATSLKKGETLRDTIKMTEAYSDVIVMRHNRDGAARFAADISKVPLLNAGDGANEHPSQTMLDLYTIQKELGSIEGKKVAFVGDLKYGRTVHSLTKALEMFNCEFYFIAPEVIQIPEYITRELDKKGIKYHIISDYKEILKEIDVLYMTRIQKERFDKIEDYEKVAGVYVIDKESIVGKCKDEMIILHPLPRVDEIKIDLDDTKHAKYFEQAANGVPARQAIFSIALGLVEVTKSEMLEKDIRKSEEIVCENEKCITKFEETDNKYVVDKDHKYCYYCNKDIKK